MRLSDWHHSLQATLYDLVRNCHHRKKVCSVKSCEMDLQNMYFLEQPYIIRRLRARRDKKRRLCWINEILSRRNLLGEFHHLHDDLLNDPQKFFDYYRMSLETFQYILSAIESSIAKDSFRETIRPVERLSTGGSILLVSLDDILSSPLSVTTACGDSISGKSSSSAISSPSLFGENVLSGEATFPFSCRGSIMTERNSIWSKKVHEEEPSSGASSPDL
ncbi:unnamed protein product [Acanthoscelides obtectus]|uniref:Uncharacterized protein n=1 Tax=Acanthoscelides obtectus TaxID=200917 RepID=A0A9P0PKH2_ACAOB|nr:unnamed protein product [Acanthoscelides obtectus]CAK1649717.1 hypothetical protein AOBTE_LOCUS16374 [Acanthoscelides obtectus]